MTTARRAVPALRHAIVLLGVLALLAALLAILTLGPRTAESAFPGANGKIVFISFRDSNFEVCVMNAGLDIAPGRCYKVRIRRWSLEGVRPGHDDT